MDKQVLVLSATLVLCLLLVNGCAGCASDCTCIVNGNNKTLANCTGDAQELWFGWSGLTSLDANAFTGLSNLDVLYLYYNQLTSFDANTFSGLSNLRNLFLEYNQLTSLDANTFDGLTNLQNLRLDNNLLTSLDANTFSGLSNLITLRLHNNRLTTLDTNVFANLSTLTELKLHNNNLTLGANVFNGLSNIKELDLTLNQLTSIDANVFSGLSILKLLDLSENQLKSLDENAFNGLSVLQTLDLSENQLTSTSLDANIFSGLSTLKLLNISANPLNLTHHLCGLKELQDRKMFLISATDSFNNYTQTLNTSYCSSNCQEIEYTCDMGQICIGAVANYTCVVDCGTPQNPNNGKYSEVHATTYQTTLNVTCNPGYKLNSSASQSTTCQANATWSSENNQPCIAVDCGTPQNPNNGKYSGVNATTYQTTLSVTCNPGYELNTLASQSTTCQANGTWSSENNQPCIAVDCGTPQNPNNGKYSGVNATMYQTTLNVTCNPGYEINPSESQSTTCQANGTWSSENNQTCIVVDCGTPQNPNNGQYSEVNATTYQTTLNVTCNPGYELNPSASQSTTCQANAIWSSENDQTCVDTTTSSVATVAPTTTGIGNNIADKNTASFLTTSITATLSALVAAVLLVY